MKQTGIKKSPKIIKKRPTMKSKFMANSVKDKDAIKKLARFKSKIRKQREALEKTRGLIYIGHIPHGFYEDEMQQFFKQFGRVTNVKVCRSSKTGNSKGYGFVEFAYPEVAKIAAESMNNYLMFKKRLVAEYVPYEKRPKYLFSNRVTKENCSLVKRRKRTVESRNRIIDEQQYETNVGKAMKKLAKKMNALKQMGIDYDVNIKDVEVENIEKEVTPKKKKGPTKSSEKISTKSKTIQKKKVPIKDNGKLKKSKAVTKGIKEVANKKASSTVNVQKNVKKTANNKSK